MLTRRQLLQRLAMGSAIATFPGLTMARAETDARFVLVVLRGAADGLAMVPPYADPDYARQRGELALPGPGHRQGVLNLDGFFGLHPALEATHRLFQRGDVHALHAIASPYRQRSHFDGQDVLENGAAAVGALRDGWLNRALKSIDTGRDLAIALAPNTPLVLRGPQTTMSWAPSRLPDADEDTLQRLEVLYSEDAFFHERLIEAQRSQALAGEMGDGRRARGAEQLKAKLGAAAKFLASPDGARIAVVEAGGWDTHANQGARTGALANQLEALDGGILALFEGLGETWQTTVVAVVTEFGRTVKVNGTRGTDHGTASAALLLGGAVNGGVTADWPGLDNTALFEGRDLRATADVRSLFKSILIHHLGIPTADVEGQVFPNSTAARPIESLVS